MSDQEKSEEPTQKKVKDSFEKGQFAKAEEINTTFLLLGFFAVLVFSFPKMVLGVRSFAIDTFNRLHQTELTGESIGHWFSNILYENSMRIAPLLVASMIMVILAGSVQSGLRLSPKALGIKFDKLDPVKGLKRIFSLKSLVQTGVDFLKFLVVGVVTAFAVYEIANNPIFYTSVSIGFLGDFIYETALLMLIYFIIAIGAIAIIHYSYQKWQTHQDLKMSKQEVKDERKNAEGDPMVKQAMKAMKQRLLQKKMLEDVPHADVVVTNPTHYAVALRYQRGRDQAPVVVAKGKNRFARKIKEIALKHQVALVENKPTARTLYKYGVVGQVIPMELYEVVAEILALVYRNNKKNVKTF